MLSPTFLWPCSLLQIMSGKDCIGYSSISRPLKVAQNENTLKRCMVVIEMRWKRKAVSRESSVTVLS